MYITQDTLSILEESQKIDVNELNAYNEEVDDEEIESFFTEAPTMYTEFKRRAEDIPVQFNKTFLGVENFVEYDELNKLAEYNECSVLDALNMVCECNEDMSIDNTYVIVDEKAKIADGLKSKTGKAKAKIKKAVKDLKGKGIKVACKKGKCKSEGCSKEGCGTGTSEGCTKEGCKGKCKSEGCSKEGCGKGTSEGCTKEGCKK